MSGTQAQTLAATGDIVITSPGTYVPPGTSWAPDSLTIDAVGGFVWLPEGTLTEARTGNVRLAAGALRATVPLQADTITLAGGTLAGTIDATIVGSMTINGAPLPPFYANSTSSIDFINRFDLRASDGVGPGFLVTTRNDANVTFRNVATIDNALIAIQAPAYAVFGITDSATTTLGPGLLAYFFRNSGLYSHNPLINRGTIATDPYSAILLDAPKLRGDGHIVIAANSSLGIVNVDQTAGEWLELLGQVSGPGTLEGIGTIENLGSTLVLGDASDFGRFDIRYRVNGGLIRFDGTAPFQITPAGAALTGVGGGARVTLDGGDITLVDATGLQPGTLDLRDGTLDHAFSFIDSRLVSGTLRLGPHRNLDFLTVAAGATLDISGAVPNNFSNTPFDTRRTLVSAGLLSLAPGADLIQPVANAGTISVATGASLYTSLATSTGRVEIAPGGTVELAGLFDTSRLAGLGSFHNLGTLILGEAIENAGQTLHLGAFGGLVRMGPAAGARVAGYYIPTGRGVLHGGTVVGDGLLDLAGVTLDAVTWQGPLVSPRVDGVAPTIDATNGLEFAGPVAIDLSNGFSLRSRDFTRLAAGALRLGDASHLLTTDAVNQWPTFSSRGTLALSPGLVTRIDAGSATLDARVINQGTLAVGPGATLTLADGAINLGTIALDGGLLVVTGQDMHPGTITFHGAPGAVVLSTTRSDATLVGFRPGDVIVAGNGGLDGEDGSGVQNGVLVVSSGNRDGRSDTIRVTLENGPSFLSATQYVPPGSNFGAYRLAFSAAAEPSLPILEPIVIPGVYIGGGDMTFTFTDEAALQRSVATFYEPALDLRVGAQYPAILVPGQTPVPQRGRLGVSALIAHDADSLVLPEGFRTVLSDAPGPMRIVGNTEPNLTVASANGGMTFLSRSAYGSFVATGGTNNFFGAGNWSLLFDAGTNTIVTGDGSDTVTTGRAANTVWLGTGANQVFSYGTGDIIVGGAGAATIAVPAGSAQIYGGAGGLDIHAGTGASTILGGAGGTTLWGGRGNSVFFGFGPLRYAGGDGADTIIGGTGSVTALGGAGGGLVWGGSAGDNRVTVSGNATAVGGGAGDVIVAAGAGTHVIYGGPGAETLSAAQSTGTDFIMAGPGPSLLRGGSGASLLVAGPGGGTLAGGAGAMLFEFINGYGGGSVDLTGFNPSLDRIALAGFAPGTAATVIAAAQSTASGATITLPDGTRILFHDQTGLAPGWFV